MTKEHTPEEIKYRLSDLGVQIGNIAIDYITELEAENAVLKEKLKEHEIVGNEQFWKNVWSWKTKAIQLTKAKELLKWFVWYFKEGSPNLVSYKHKVKETEQFINNEVEK